MTLAALDAILLLDLTATAFLLAITHHISKDEKRKTPALMLTMYVAYVMVAILILQLILVNITNGS